MIYRPRNRNERTHEAPKSTARWFDERKDRQNKPCGFEPERWAHLMKGE